MAGGTGPRRGTRRGAQPRGTRRCRTRRFGGVVAAVLGVMMLGLLSTACTSSSDSEEATGAPSSSAPASVPATPAAGASPGPVAGSPTTPVAAGAAGSGAGPGGGGPYCGPTRYAEEIKLERWATGQFRIEVRPTPAARRASDTDAATAELWRDVQACVTGLAGGVADSLYDQLECHEHLALLPALDGAKGYATGETYDLESWRPTMASNVNTWIRTHCGNTLGTDPTTASIGTSRPDGRTSVHADGSDPERR